MVIVRREKNLLNFFKSLKIIFTTKLFILLHVVSEKTLCGNFLIN